jgi:hypothetical protein
MSPGASPATALECCSDAGANTQFEVVLGWPKTPGTQGIGLATDIHIWIRGGELPIHKFRERKGVKVAFTSKGNHPVDWKSRGLQLGKHP